MQKTRIHIELVPVEEAKRILKRQEALAKRRVKRMPARGNSVKMSPGLRKLTKKRDGPGI